MDSQVPKTAADLARGRRLLKRRLQQNLSQRVLAHRIGCNQSTYCDMEKGGSINSRWLAKLVVELKTSVNYILEGVETPEAEADTWQPIADQVRGIFARMPVDLHPAAIGALEGLAARAPATEDPSAVLIRRAAPRPRPRKALQASLFDQPQRQQRTGT